MKAEIFRHSEAKPWRYRNLDRYQRALAKQIQEQGASGRMILSELAPVITVGKRGWLGNALSHNQSKIEVYPTDRGGFETYHGPGQWVFFAVDRLDRLTGETRGVRRFVELLLTLAREVAGEWGVSSEIRQGDELGLWSEQGKLASVGIHVQSGIVMHGLALNVYPTELSFCGISPCGLKARPGFLLGESLCGAEREDEFIKIGHLLREAGIARFKNQA